MLHFLFRCTPATETPTQQAFYYFKTDLRLHEATLHALEKREIGVLYVRFFDIALEHSEPIPNAPLTVTDTISAAIEVVPVVFITNEVWQRPSGAMLDDSLAALTIQLITEIYAQTGTRHPVREIQLDCDWTNTTRERWFSFIKAVKKRLPTHCDLNITIRLHQYKRPDLTGVPPCSRGTLMLYNTGDIGDENTQNSILDSLDAQKWLAGARPYPIDLDVALPAFRWVPVYRLGTLHHIMHDVPLIELQQDTARFEALGAHRFKCRVQTLFDGYYLHIGDVLRYESVDSSTNSLIYQHFLSVNKHKPRRLLWYHLTAFGLE